MDHTAMSDEKSKLAEAEGLKRLAFFGIAISTVATLTAIVAVPMLYNYMQHVQSSLQNEVDFCRHRPDGLWDEFHRDGVRFHEVIEGRKQTG
ncbi:nematode cuticle collagen domain protein [Oesophagostomum dentatum]|uniref:Nematode cuticle collagen domain protein n=1 Tax=Oesophagostomum dentatum TaxID=61180 RepID=A0A0B1TAM0_OESDE|nr:nematode cuticle collagen domain protein [Oesophagostomum dentatum]